MQAAFLNIKIKNLKKETLKRIQNSKTYFKELKNNKTIQLPKVLNCKRKCISSICYKNKKKKFVKKIFN